MCSSSLICFAADGARASSGWSCRTTAICFEGGGRREVNVEGDSEAALILDVIRRVLY